MFYIAVCDDEPKVVTLLAGYLAELRSRNLQFECLPFFNGLELIREYDNQRRFDLIILDMLMKPLNGMETAKLIRKYDTTVPIMIVTATPEYAMDGYQVNAYRYILKPVDKQYFQQEVSAVLCSLARTKDKYFSFTNEYGLSRISLAEIFYFESNMRTISVCLKQTRQNFIGRISNLEEELVAHGFVRIHKSYLVNLRHVRNIFKDTVTLDNGEVLPLSRHRGKSLRESFLAYLKDNV